MCITESRKNICIDTANSWNSEGGAEPEYTDKVLSILC